MRRDERRPGDRGAVAAELAVAMPAVLLVLALVLAALGAGTARLRALDAAADAARMLGRGDPGDAVAARVALLDGASWTARRAEGLVCVRVSVPGPRPLPALGPQTGSSCALDDSLDGALDRAPDPGIGDP